MAYKDIAKGKACKAAYYAANKDKVKAYCAANKDKINAYAAANKDKINRSKRSRRSLQSSDNFNSCLILLAAALKETK